MNKKHPALKRYCSAFPFSVSVLIKTLKVPFGLLHYVQTHQPNFSGSPFLLLPPSLTLLSPGVTLYRV